MAAPEQLLLQPGNRSALPRGPLLHRLASWKGTDARVRSGQLHCGPDETRRSHVRFHFVLHQPSQLVLLIDDVALVLVPLVVEARDAALDCLNASLWHGSDATLPWWQALGGAEIKKNSSEP